MPTSVGFFTAAAQELVNVVIQPTPRFIDSFTAQVTIEETHTDELEIAEHPVEQGAPIADHSFLRPAEVVISCGYSNSPTAGGGVLGSIASAVSGTIGGISSLLSGNNTSQVKAIYAKFLDLQRSRAPFTVVTGKRTYYNMLVKSLHTSTTKESENSLIMRVVCRQIIIVSTKVVSVSAPASDQAAPAVTSPTSNEGTKQLGPAPTYNGDAGATAINPQLRH